MSAPLPASTPCPHCQVPLVRLWTRYGRLMGFETATVPREQAGPWDGYALTTKGGVVCVAELPARVVEGMERVLMRHRCRRYWRSQVGKDE